MDASDVFDAHGGGGGGSDSKRPRELSTGTDLRQSFMSMDLDNVDGGVGADGEDRNGTTGDGNEKKCCLDIRQRKRYLIRPQGTCGKWHYMTSVSALFFPVAFSCFYGLCTLYLFAIAILIFHL